MAAKKLDLSYNIEPDVPPCACTSCGFRQLLTAVIGVEADYARIRQGEYC